jgi:N-acetylglucosaminyldiphosphoundecaprenol N-acetyl-beta-D-mannosaminyltransferase
MPFIERQLSQVVGIEVDVGSMEALTHSILEIAKIERNNTYVCVANVHMLTTARQDPSFHSVLKNATLVVPDGMPLVWTQKLKGFTNAERVCGPDLMLELCKLASQSNLSIYLLGSDQKTLQLLSSNLLKKNPNLNISGSYVPEKLPENPKPDLELAEKINQSGASILFVGLGCPKQENWCANYAPYLNATAIGVGAAFDFHAGTKKRPPLFIQKWGFEWLYRLFSEPTRLWKRYFKSNLAFIYYSLIDLVCRKRI